MASCAVDGRYRVKNGPGLALMESAMQSKEGMLTFFKSSFFLNTVGAKAAEVFSNVTTLTDEEFAEAKQKLLDGYHRVTSKVESRANRRIDKETRKIARTARAAAARSPELDAKRMLDLLTMEEVRRSPGLSAGMRDQVTRAVDHAVNKMKVEKDPAGAIEASRAIIPLQTVAAIKTGHCSSPDCLLPEIPLDLLKKCSGCRIAMYCSSDCQKKAWPAHKKVCMFSQDKNRHDRKAA